MPTESLTLYAVEDDLAALLDTEEMVSDPQERLAILNEIAQTHSAAVAKRDKVAQFIRTLEHRESAVDSEIERLHELKQKWAREKKNFEAYVIRVIEEYAPEKRGVKRLVGNVSELSIAKNPDSVEITDRNAVPLEYKAVTIGMPGASYATLLDRLQAAGLFEEGTLLAASAESVPIKAEIKKALKAGEDVPGADLKFGASRLVVK